jgi:hypothetical protein
MKNASSSKEVRESSHNDEALNRSQPAICGVVENATSEVNRTMRGKRQPQVGTERCWPTWMT